MIFSRSKSKQSDYRGHSADFEEDSIRCWRNVAAGIQSTEPSEPRPVFSLGTETPENPPAFKTVESRRTIDLVHEAVLPETHWSGQEALPRWNTQEQDSSIKQPELFPIELKQEVRESSVSEPILLKEAAPVLELTKEIPKPSLSIPELDIKDEVEAALEAKLSEPILFKDGLLPTPDLNVSAAKDIRRRFGTNLRSALGQGTVIEGTFSFDTPVCIDGTLIGEVQSSSALVVGSHAEVRANVSVGSIIVLGIVSGDIVAEDLIEIRAGGQVDGSVQSRRLVVEDGGCLNGQCVLLTE